MFSETDRLDMLKAVGAEEFDTGRPERLWAVLEGEFNNPEITGIAVNGEYRWLECRLSDKETHELRRGSPLTRLKDGEQLFVRDFEPNRSSGFLVIRLTSK